MFGTNVPTGFSGVEVSTETNLALPVASNCSFLDVIIYCTVPAIKKLPFSFRSVPYHRNGNDTNMLSYAHFPFRLFPFVTFNLHCVRRACVQASKVQYNWLNVCGFLWGLPNYLWLQVTAKRNLKLTSNGNRRGYVSSTFSTTGQEV